MQMKKTTVCETSGESQSDSCGCAQNYGEESGDFRVFLVRLAAATAAIVVAAFLPLPVWAQIALYAAAYITAGAEVLVTASKNILRGKFFDENFLMAVASLGAFAIGEMSEAVAVMIFYGTGELLQELAVTRSKKNISKLMDIRPDFATLKTAEGTKIVAPDTVKIGDIIVVKPGEKIPLDGTVIFGSSFIDTKALTGEPVPRRAAEKDEVYSGSVNLSGLLEVRVTKTFGESTVSRILDLVQNAGSKKAESEKFITKFSAYYTPAVVFTALAVAIVPPLLNFGSFDVWIYKALSFLIISCPCALVISIPISFFGGIGGAARQGILVKGGNYLEALNSLKTICFDKTGTLTKGVFKVTKRVAVAGTTEEQVLELAARAEAHSIHPIASSILEAYGKPVQNIGTVTEEAGYGIIAFVTENGKETCILAGNAKLMQREKVKDFNSAALSVQDEGTVVFIALDGVYKGSLVISDEIREGAAAAVSAIKKAGIEKLVMLTGDTEAAAKKIAAELGLDDYRAGLLPQDKVSELEKVLARSEKNGKTAFVGDGINDAPVLTRADIGIAMGGIGSDAALEAADIVIMNDDIGKIAVAVKIAAKTRIIVSQNIVFALSVKLVIMLLAFLGITSIWFAVFADVGVALLALLNALRALHLQERSPR